MQKQLQSSELVLNPDGSVYHIALKNEDIADDVILVGDPGRVKTVASFFDHIELERSHREFNTITGTYKGKRISVLSTGIGTDNIDIVLNELDAAVNIDLDKKEFKQEHRSLNLIRLGTCGALHEDLVCDSVLASEYGLGFDGLAYYYELENSVIDQSMSDAFNKHSNWPERLSRAYAVACSRTLLDKLAKDYAQGITATATGFYGPQARSLRLNLSIPDMHERLKSFNYEGHRILNFEMETSGLYYMSGALGHQALTMCTVVANRARKEFSKDYKAAVKEMIANCLDGLTND